MRLAISADALLHKLPGKADTGEQKHARNEVEEGRPRFETACGRSGQSLRGGVSKLGCHESAFLASVAEYRPPIGEHE